MLKPILRKAFTLMLAAAASLSAVAATENKVVKLNFDESMFKINETNGFIKDIVYTKDDAMFSSDSTMPALPIVTFSISTDPNVDCSYTTNIVSKKLFRENVDVATAPQVFPTSMLGQTIADKRGRYTGAYYPSQICSLNGKSEWSDETHLYFSCSPFVYDGNTRNLYLIEELEVDITVSEHLSKQKLSAEVNRMSRKPAYISATFDSIRRPGVDIEPPVKQDSLPLENDSAIMLNREKYYWDYVIITNNTLKPTFETMLKWKRAKGLSGGIVTVEDIEKTNKGKDLPAKIKDYLKNSLRTKHIKYVLLGGDDTVVPVRYCDGNHRPEKKYDDERETPADLYYACINDAYDWDRNGNGVYGEKTDLISMAPSFAVTRVPVGAPWAAKAYVDKLLEYECAPKWNNRFLLWGNILDIEHNITASGKGKKFYESYITDYSAFDKEELFDDTNTLGYDVNGRVELENLRAEIKSGYNFISALTHGSQTAWRIADRRDSTDTFETVYFNAHVGGNINENCHTIITTMACRTNAFDITDSLNSEASLSEMFIRNVNSGVVGYLGCSRSGWYYPMRDYVSSYLSLGYEGEFYKYLLAPDQPYNFGAVVQAAKAQKIPYTYNDDCRLIMFGLNPLGDPEMPVFTEEPKIFNGIMVDCVDRAISIITNESGCRISIRGLGSATNYCNVFDNLTSVSAYELPDQFSVCVTKPNYIPWFYGFNRQPDGSYRMVEFTYEDIYKDNFGLQPIKGQIVEVKSLNDGPFVSVNGKYEICTLVSDSANSAYLLVTNVNSVTGEASSMRYDIENGSSSTTITVKGLSAFGMRSVVNLIVDGEIQETIKLY